MGLVDPWDALPPGRSAKLARECTEVHAANQNAVGLVEGEWGHFKNLEVLWVNNNRISRMEHLQDLSRIKEIFMQDNRIVSLEGLSTFKFLKVLRAGNNRIRNLDKQLGVLSRFAFLKELDLFDNPVAEEPDYRLRVIYHLPQVELLDLKSVKPHEREQAAEVVPNMNVVSSVAPGDILYPPKQKWVNTPNEEFTFQTAERIKLKWQKAEEEALRQMYSGLGGLVRKEFGPDEGLLNNRNLEMQVYRKTIDAYELDHLNEWEKNDVINFLKELKIDRSDLTKTQFVDTFLKPDLGYNESGLEPIPRVTQLANRIGKVPDPAAFEVPRAENASGSEQEEAELPPNSVWRKFSDDATNPIIKAADMRGFFLSEALLWRYEDDFSLQERTDFLYAEAKKAGPPIGSDPAKAAELSRKALRLEGIKTRKQAERLEKKEKNPD
mmetsp:Transcript_13784/g.33932  ORF Transcript_13784/g.33932 Transcript_13784/m.33932 type:complete len:438 (+) Transcript_13784:520-1833(+)